MDIRIRANNSYRMQSVFKVICWITCLFLMALPDALAESHKLSSFQPGALWPDNNGIHINAHGGGILYHQGTYYWFGEHKIEGRRGNSAHVGVHCYSSKDLYNWKDESIALEVSKDPNSPIVEGCIIERPKVAYNKKTKKFVMWFHNELKGKGYRAAQCGVAVSDNVTGPYTFLKSIRPDTATWPLNAAKQQKENADLQFVQDYEKGQESRDMTIFVDDDETAYHIYASEDNNTLHISQLTDDYLSHAGKYVRVFENRYMEAPAIFKYEGKYYFIGSGCTGWRPNAARSAVADSIFGPWKELGNPCRGNDEQNEITFESQSTFILPVQGRKGDFIFMADRWRPRNAIDGRYIWLPIQWEDDKPVIKWLDEWDLSFFDKPPQDISGNITRKPLSSYDPQVEELLSRMTLEEKIGQMVQAESSELKDPNDIRTYYLGSILSGGHADPKSGNSMQDWAQLYESLQKRALSTRLGIPLLYGIDAVHGHSNVLGAVILPHNIGMGCTRNPELVEQAARVTAKEVRATGIQWTFAPCVTVPQDERWGRTYEGYSENPELVALLTAAAIRGFQGSDLSDSSSILACAKHYVGDGGTAFGSSQEDKGLDQGDTRVDEATLRRIHLLPYISAVKAGVASIMPSYSSWNGLKCSANKYLLTDVLKQELGFEGFLISDYTAVQQVHPDFKTAIGICVNAGMDMAMEPARYREYFAFLKELVDEEIVPMSRIDDAVKRILRVKFAMGLMAPDHNHMAVRSLQKDFGSPAHRAIARQAVRESLVLLKNDSKTLPISKTTKRIHVAGKSADNIGNQCGGWTIDWQGRSGNVTEGGTTILAAIKAAVSQNSVITFSENGESAAGADIGILVIGEIPYAEGNGDAANLSLSAEDVNAFHSMKEANIPVVVILISGRPLIITETLNQADAFIAAWLPGTEGAGVADVIFGDYNPTGKLSFSWPRSNSQIPVNFGDDEYDPLFKYGFGLSY